jgi:hypothetical protein
VTVGSAKRILFRYCTKDIHLRWVSHILYDYMGISGPPDAHIVPIHHSRQMKSCFIAKYERVCETFNFKSLLHFSAEIKTHNFVIIAEMLKSIGFTLESLTDNSPNC